MGVYLFNERSGSVVHDGAHRGIDLCIPKRFSLSHQQFLKSFWKDFKPATSYVADVVLNIAGCTPSGSPFSPTALPCDP